MSKIPLSTSDALATTERSLQYFFKLPLKKKGIKWEKKIRISPEKDYKTTQIKEDVPRHS